MRGIFLLLGRALASEEDTLEECWLDEPLGSESAWAKACCRPRPCGQRGCWAPPTFTYEFCCGVDACRPLIVEEVKRALDSAVESLATSNAVNASSLAFRLAPQAFRALWQLAVQLEDGDQVCACAIAYAVVMLLWYSEESPKLARAVQARWFLQVDWIGLIADGWGAIFGWLDRWPGPAGSGGAAGEAELPEDLTERGLRLQKVVAKEQTQARQILTGLQEMGAVSVSDLLRALRARGIFRRMWHHLSIDLKWRKKGQKCAVTEHDGVGRWRCEPWEYHINANFSSILPRYSTGHLGQSNVAVCVLGAPRTVVRTYPSTRDKVVKQLGADTFVYVPFPGSFTPALEEELRDLGGAVTAILVPDVDRETFEARVYSELKDPNFKLYYALAKGPWRAPLHRQMGSSMWGYHNQHGCRRMVQSYESQRGWRYEWVVFARAEMFWTNPHPPIEVLDPAFVHIPLGQDNNYYDLNPLRGVNDRHAVVPQRWFDAYFNRYECILDGSAWKYLAKVAEGGYQINTEQYLFLHLEAFKVPLRRFAPVAFLSHCSEGPQCQHLYKGTNLGKQRWTQTAKYFNELVETRRTSLDDVHNIHRLSNGWIWIALWPHTHWIWAALPKKSRAKPLEVVADYELLSTDVACGLTKHGPISSLRWVFLKKCQCHA